MKRDIAAALCMAAGLAACAAAPEVPVPVPAHPVALRNADFEASPRTDRGCPDGWYCTAHADPNAFRYFHDEAKPLHGRRSVCIEPAGKEPWGLLSQDVDAAALRGARVRFSVAARTEGVVGDGAGPYILARSHAGTAIAEDKRLISGTNGWRRISVELAVPAELLGVEVGVALEGRGRVCVDDAVLEIMPSGESPYNQAPVTPKQPSQSGESK